jgi:hypothetical protein
VVQRRGGRVNIPEIGSRDGGIVFGGILGFCAELRRKLFWGNLDLGFLGILLGVLRGGGEEGGPLCAFRGIYLCVGLGVWAGLERTVRWRPKGVRFGGIYLG